MVVYVRLAAGVPAGKAVTAPEGTASVVVMVCADADSGFMNVIVADASSSPIPFSEVLLPYISAMWLRFCFTVNVYVPAG